MLRNLIDRILRRKPNTSNSEISFKQGYDLTELPIVTFTQGDIKLNFILDTGANNNMINESELSRLKYEKTSYETESFGIEGIVKKNKFCVITLNYAGKEYPYHYMVTNLDAAFSEIKKESGVNLHGIIGSNFFNHYKYVLDFDKLIAYSKQ